MLSSLEHTDCSARVVGGQVGLERLASTQRRLPLFKPLSQSRPCIPASRLEEMCVEEAKVQATLHGMTCINMEIQSCGVLDYSIYAPRVLPVRGVAQKRTGPPRPVVVTGTPGAEMRSIA